MNPEWLYHMPLRRYDDIRHVRWVFRMMGQIAHYVTGLMPGGHTGDTCDEDEGEDGQGAKGAVSDVKMIPI